MQLVKHATVAVFFSRFDAEQPLLLQGLHHAEV